MNSPQRLLCSHEQAAGSEKRKGAPEWLGLGLCGHKPARWFANDVNSEEVTL